MPHDTTEPTRQYSVRTRKLERRWRAGLCFGLVAVAVALTAAQAEQVQADPELVCSAVPAPGLTLEAVPAVPAVPEVPEVPTAAEVPEVPAAAEVPDVPAAAEAPAAATDGVKPKAKVGK